ncbi:single-stranded DNA-binding protein [Corynebacterium sp. HS2168-gen11]|uniref:single-stranded DNA-binding protein n=1 Tax=Corynebacterium sp. HS2168-gen11 TaxID=2974027 RepID=UPI00216B6567|nr:single-stranded DNA-binding protein [Corynebacterium sp. HS2168-gen11]MCS4535309.1 single-stranded DNA-binding protein [Corynebacterium sp. HS2168-gen11]
MYTSTTIVGNLTHEPTQIVFPSGATLTKFRLASSRYRKADQASERKGEKQRSDAYNDDNADTKLEADTSGFVSFNQLYIDVECWGNLADNVLVSLQESGKGCQVIAVGSLIHQEWEKDGRRESKIVLRANHVGVDMKKYAVNFKRREVLESKPSGANFADLVGVGAGMRVNAKVHAVEEEVSAPF